MTPADETLWESFKVDRSVKLDLNLATTKPDMARLREDASFIEEAIKIIPACPASCTAAVGRCIAGECICHAGITESLCLSGAVLAEEVPQLLIHGMSATIGGRTVAVLNNAWTGTTLLTCVIVAFAVGLLAGLVIMMFSDYRKRELAKSILGSRKNFA